MPRNRSISARSLDRNSAAQFGRKYDQGFAIVACLPHQRTIFAMLKFLFWNIKQKSLEGQVARAVAERNIDFLLLAECVDPLQVLKQLHQCGVKGFNHHTNPTPTAVELFSQLPLERVTSLGDYSGLTFRRVLPIIGREMLIIGAHLPSKLHMTEVNQSSHCASMARKIQDYELRVGHARTLLVGDLNMNPFEAGMVTANGFHATSSKDIAKRSVRTVQGEQYRLFYNPMWNHLGDKNDGPPGTFYRDKAQYLEYFWHTLDQVLIRPDLVDEFLRESLEIITTIDGNDLLDVNGRPNSRIFSDHLPIYFSLNPVEVI